MKNNSLGDITGEIEFPGDLESEYGGYFYGSHLCEMCMSVFGYDVKHNCIIDRFRTSWL